MRVRRHSVVFALLCASCWPAARAYADPVVFARHLALSPDGRTLAFTWAGDIWSVAIEGGIATRLTAHPADDGFPVFSRDGQQIAFASNRQGSNCVFVMQRDGSSVRRLTYGDRSEIPTSWSADGREVIFQTNKEGHVSWDPAIYRVSATGGQAWKAVSGYGGDAAVAASGKHIAFVRGASNWWRRNYRGSANYDIWLFNVENGEYSQFTKFDGTDRLPRWDSQGAGIFYLSDRAGTVNIWYQPLVGEPRQITHLSSDDVRDLAVSADGRTLAFTHWDKLYAMAYPDGKPREIQISAAGDSPRSDVNLETLTNGASEMEISPKGDEIALVVRGEIFVIKTAEDKLTRRVTNSSARDQHVTWSPDGKALFFTSDDAGQEDIYRATSAETPPQPLSDSLRFRIERVTDNPEPEYAPSISPDGKTIAFVRGRGDLVSRTLVSGVERVLVPGWNAPNYRWSPDSQWIAYDAEDAEYNSDIWLVRADGSVPPVNITRHPDNDSSPQWSADGQILAFTSRRIGMDADLYLVFLSRALDEKSNVDKAEYFESAEKKVGKVKPPKSAAASGAIALAGQPAPASQPASGAASPPASGPTQKQEEAAGELGRRFRKWLRATLLDDESTKKKDKSDGEAKEDEDKDEPKKQEEKYEYELESAFMRIRRVTSLPGDQQSFSLAPDGKTLVFSSTHEGSANLYQINWNGEDVKKALSGAHSALHWTLDGKRLSYLKGGVPGSCKPGGSDAKTHAFRAKMAIDIAAEAHQKFDDAARQLGLRFYHPTMKNLDWSALARKYRALAVQVKTTGEFNEIFNMLQGELNASHLGISGPGGGPSEAIGYLGCTFDPAYRGPGLRVQKIVRNAPADRDESRLFPGDVILKINGITVGADAAPLEQPLLNTAGDPVILEYLPSPQRASSQPATTTSTTAMTSEPAGEPSPKELVIRPAPWSQYNDLAYDAWVEENRRYVDEKSGGRIGYCHIRGMGAPEFYTFERDLYAAANGKEGLIIDVRFNGGGWTADWVMSVLSVKRHAYTIGRGGERGYPQDRLVFYAWTRPATMMCNQYSYSNAEIVSHAFKNLKRGPLVGMPTFGAVISTGAYGLIDGSRIRMPFRGWYTIPGEVDMENNGAIPDIIVPQTPADEAISRQAQLDAAIQATLDQLGQQANR